jgi:hypothetical protein
MNALDTYRTEAREQGIPEHAIDEALRLARPRLELRPRGDSNAPVAGQWGGHPQLPPDVEWSGYPDFVASVDCAGAPVGMLDIPLPPDGHLLFFADRREPNWSPETDGRVVYVPAGTVTAERIPDETDMGYTWEPYPLRGELERHMPEPHDNAFEDLVAGDGYGNLFEGISVDAGCDFVLGGYSYAIQDDPSDWPDQADEAYVMLARAAYSFVDVAGRCAAFWLIRRRDLAERNFADVILIVQDYA